MKDSSLIRLLQSLTAEQMKGLDRFLQSPYHNTNQTISRLFSYVADGHPDMESPKLDREKAFRHLYPNKAFKDVVMRKQMSTLKSAVEEFIKVEQLKKNNKMQQRLLLQHYYDSEGYESFSRRILQSMDDLKKQPHRDAQYHLEMLWLNEELFYHPGNEDHYRFRSNQELISLLEHLDLFFGLYKLRLETDLQIRNNLVEEHISPFITFESIRNDLSKLSKEYVLIWIHLQLLDFQGKKTKIDPAAFNRCMNVFQEHIGQMGVTESGAIWNALINAAIGQYNLGYEEFVDLTAQLFKLADEQEMILHHGKLQTSTFLNATFSACGAHEFDWVNSFIERYQDLLDEGEREHVVNLSKGVWHYHKGKVAAYHSPERLKALEEALGCISQIPYSGMAFDLRLRSLNFRILFDLFLPRGARDPFFDCAHAFTNYLANRKDFTKERKSAYDQFIQGAKKLARIFCSYLDGNPKEEELKKFNEALLKKQNIAYKIWLIKAVRELQQFPHQ